MQDNKFTTNTQIRNFYSEGISYLNISFFNTNLSFKFYPFTGKDENGKSNYDMKACQATTVNFEGAYSLYKVAEDIINGKVNATNLPIPCAGGASLTLERKLAQDGKMETLFTINKNGISIPFKFQTINQQVNENGTIVTKTIESGLGAFMKTIDGYLTGINAERHLNKLTDDYVASLNQNNDSNANNNYNSNNGNKNYNNYKKQYNGYNNKRYNNNYQYNNGPKQQNLSSYNIPN
jgi:hypothetical protein